MAIINALTDTWNNVATTFTAVKMTVTDTTSAAGSKLIDLLVGASSKFSVDKAGITTSVAYKVSTSINSTFSSPGGGQLLIALDSGDHSFIGNSKHNLGSGIVLKWTSSSNPQGTEDTGVARKTAKVVEFNNGTAGSYTGSAFGTGSQTVAQLTAAATAGAGARTFVTDATATTFLSTVAGGGANKVPVVSDGTNWLIG